MYKDAHDLSDEYPVNVPGLTVPKRARPRRKRFGIVHYATGAKSSFLIIPFGIGITAGDKITFYHENGGISFRVEPDGMYSVYGGGTTTKALKSGLCDPLRDFATHRVRDIVVKTVKGGWFVPFDQFD